jgi:hypothetical protein
MSHAYTYEETLAAAQKTNWRIEDVIGEGKRLDFSKPFLPEGLARVRPLDFLSKGEQVVLNQIRGHEYLAMFGLVEEFILPFVMDHARPRLDGDDHRVRALLQFAGEEAKHIQLFRRFRREFESGWGSRCEVIGPPEAVAKQVLSHDPLSVALLILHIEWFTQKHYLEGVKDDQGIDPLFKSLLKHLWIEEAQHAKLDTLMVEALAAGYSREGIARAFDGYLAIGGFLDQGLEQQARLNLASFEAAAGRKLSPDEEKRYTQVQHQALRWTYLGSGMTHPSFRESVQMLDPDLRRRLDEIAPTFV